MWLASVDAPASCHARKAKAARSRGRDDHVLSGQINRYRGPFVLRNDQDKHSKVSTWCLQDWSG